MHSARESMVEMLRDAGVLIGRQLRALERALDRGPGHLAVALRAVTVARREERAVDRDLAQSVDPATRSLQSMLPPKRRGGVVEWFPGLGGTAHDAEERAGTTCSSS